MRFDYAAMPDALPYRPTGWTMKLIMHYSFGGGKGAAAYTILDPTGREMPFTMGYNTQEKWRGFSLPGVKPVLTWKELCGIWPVWIKRARAKQQLGREAYERGKVEAINNELRKKL
jgi:hypothetical protein